MFYPLYSLFPSYFALTLESAGPLNMWPSNPFGLWPILLYHACTKAIVVVLVMRGHLQIILISAFRDFDIQVELFITDCPYFLFQARMHSISYLRQQMQDI